jgi:thiol-disulfide isomerase/thioredoxin
MIALLRIFAIMVGFCALPLQADAESTPSAADKAWERLGYPSHQLGAEPIDGMRTTEEAMRKWSGNHNSTPGYWRFWEQMMRRYREHGLQFWRDYPDDERRYSWLEATLWTPPLYWKDLDQGAAAMASGRRKEAIIDTQAKEDWDMRLLALRAETMALAKPSAQAGVRYTQMFSRRSERIHEDRPLAATELQDNAREVVDIVASYADMDVRSKRIMVEGLLRDADTAGEYRLESAFIEALKTNPSGEIRSYALARERIARARVEPLSLPAMQSLQGAPTMLEQLRGKVVFVDVWANTCTSCIAAMPKLAELEKKYGRDGFQVFGVWLHAPDGPEAMKKAREILKRQGATWPNGALAGQEMKDFMERYGVNGVPVTWLLDRDGKLLTSDLSTSQVPGTENKVRKALGLAPLP